MPVKITREPKKRFVPSSPAARRLAKELKLDLSLVQGSGPNGRVVEADVIRQHEEARRAVKMTPLAKKMIREAGLEQSEVAGSGEAGKITKKDVEFALDGKTAVTETHPAQSLSFSGMRKSIADNMSASPQNSAQLTLFREVDVTGTGQFLDIVQENYKEDQGVKVSYHDVIILAASRALKRFPQMNSTLVKDEIQMHDLINIGIAVALPEGLIVPVLREADKKGLVQISKEARELARKAGEDSLSVEEASGGTFTVTNLGMFGVEGFTPILRPPETGILGVGRVKEKPAVHDGKIVIRSLMFLSLTFDHRVVDGAMGGSFLETLARSLENPMLALA